jgi:hypothetical protein
MGSGGDGEKRKIKSLRSQAPFLPDSPSPTLPTSFAPALPCSFRMRRPPDMVALVAKTHWAVGAVVLGSLIPLGLFTRKLPFVEFGARTYIVASAQGGLYLLTGTLVWFGAPPGRLLSRICGLLYLARPALGSRLWDIMSDEEYRAHFQPQKTDQP